MTQDRLVAAVEGLGMSVEHSRFYATYKLRSDTDPVRFRQDLLAYIQSHSVDPAPVESLSPSLRARDFWALVLADQAGDPFEIYSYDTLETRDENVEGLLERLQSSHE